MASHKGNSPRRVTRRTAERLIRAAYEYEHLAHNFRHEGWDDEAGGLNEIASRLGKMGRRLADQLS